MNEAENLLTPEVIQLPLQPAAIDCIEGVVRVPCR